MFKSLAPAEVSNNDQLTIPVNLDNDRPKAGAATLSARGTGWEAIPNADRTLDLKEAKPKRELFHVKPAILEGDAILSPDQIQKIAAYLDTRCRDVEF